MLLNWAVDGRRLRRCMWGGTINTRPAVTAGPVPLTTTQCFTHRPGVKCVQSNTCPCRVANRPCTSGFQSEVFRNRGPTWDPTSPRLTTNVSKNIEEAQEAALTLCRATPLVISHQNALAFSPSVLPRGD